MAKRRSKGDRGEHIGSLTGGRKKREIERKKTRRPVLQISPDPTRVEIGPIRDLIVKHYLPPRLFVTISNAGFSHRQACYVEYAGSDFGETFADFTINEFGVQVASLASLEKVKEFCGTIISSSAAIMILETPESPDRSATYNVFQAWCQRIWNAHTKAHIETVWLGDLPTAQVPAQTVPPDIATNGPRAETGVRYPWSQQIEGIEIAQYVTGSVENVVDQIIRLSQGMRILPRLQKIGRPIGERAERRITREYVLKKYDELVRLYGDTEGIRLPHLLRALGMSAPTFSRYGFRFRDVQKEHREYARRLNQK